VCWLSDRPLRPGARLLVKHGTRTVPAIVGTLLARFDEQRLSTVDGPATLTLNEIGRVAIRTAEPLPVDDYATSRRTGSFILIDPADGATLAAGMVGGRLPVLEAPAVFDADGCPDPSPAVRDCDLTSPGP
jgi:sulfate adenylyltransferase subunit 1